MLTARVPGDGEDSESGEITIRLPKAQKTVVYGIAIAGGLGTYLLLGQLMGGGMGMPRFEAAVVGNLELIWLIPLSLIGTICGWLYFVSEHASEALAHAIGARPVVKAMLAVWRSPSAARSCPTPCLPARPRPTCSWRPI